MSYDNNMQVIVRKVVSDKQNAPLMSVSIEIDGTKYTSGLWRWTRKDGSLVLDKNGNAMYNGKLKVDDYTPKDQGQPETQNASPDPEFDDDIPF